MLKYDLLPGVRMTPEERKREVAAKGLKPIVGWHEDKGRHHDGNVIEVDDSCGGVKFGFEDPELPMSFYAGVTGCEGRNRFYDFRVRTSDATLDPLADGEH